MGRVSWVARVMGQLSDGSRGSWVTKYDPMSALIDRQTAWRNSRNVCGIVE